MTSLVDALLASQKIVTTICLVLLAVIAGGSLVIDAHHAHTWAEQHVPLFWSLFGFAAASTIIGVARWLGRSGIQAPTDFYDRAASTSCEEEV